MNEEQLKECEDIVETIMRAMGYGSYDDYNSEEIRDKWRKEMRDDKNDSVV